MTRGARTVRAAAAAVPVWGGSSGQCAHDQRAHGSRGGGGGTAHPATASLDWATRIFFLIVKMITL